MKPGPKFSAKLLPETGEDRSADVRRWEIEERIDGTLMRTFVGVVQGTQMTRPNLTADIEEWCELRLDKLPPNGGKVPIDLDEVRL